MDNRVIDVDLLTKTEKRLIKKQIAEFHILLQEHDCTLTFKGYCTGCSSVYIELHTLKTELRARS